jgi:hypothetical protein
VLLVGHPFAKVKADILDDNVNLDDNPALITMLGTGFAEHGYCVTVKRKLEAHT